MKGFEVFFSLLPIQCLSLRVLSVSVSPHIGMEGTFGRTIALEQVCGKEQMVGKSYPLVAVMMIRPQQILR